MGPGAQAGASGPQFWVNYVGKGAYTPELFVREARALGFSRRISPTHFYKVNRNDYVIFATWRGIGSKGKKSPSNGIARVFAIGVVTGFAIALQGKGLGDIDRIEAWAKEKLRDPEVSKDKETVELLNRLLQLISEVRPELLVAIGSPGATVERGCGSYVTHSVSEKTMDGVREIMEIAARLGQVVKIATFIEGRLLPINVSFEVAGVPFTRSVLKAPDKVVTLVKKAIADYVKGYESSKDRAAQEALELSERIKAMADALYTDYLGLKRRTAEEKKALLSKYSQGVK